MGKRIFWIFLFTVAFATTVAVVYLQSESFARFLKREIQVRVAKNLGIDLGFDRLKIGILPPSISLVNVDVKVLSPQNKLGLATDTVLKAGTLGFSFRMIQAFSSGMAVNKVFVSDAVLKILVPKSGGDPSGEKLSSLVHKPIRFRLGDRFKLSIRQLELKNTFADISWRDAGQVSHAVVKNISYLAITPSDEGTNLVLNLEEFDLRTPKVSQSLKVLKANADVQKNLILLSTLDVQRRDAALHASGKLVGLIDKIEEARPDLNLILRSPLGELSDFYKNLGSIGGDILADVKVVGKLKDPSVQGKVELTGFRHSMWSLDKIEAAGSYGGGVAVLDSLSASAGGGKISLKNKLELPVPIKPEPISAQLHFESAKFEDFAGDLRKSVNNLRMRIDGSVSLRADLYEGQKGNVALGSISAQPSFTLTDLELNNQTYGKTRPYKRLFKVAPFQLAGHLLWKQDELRVSDTKFTFSSGVMGVGGTFSEHGGFNLTGTIGNANLGVEIGEIGGLPFAGKGALTIGVHGPSNDVKIDFDVDQKDARFAHFDFGTLSGRVTYEDKNDLIQIVGVNGKKGGAPYSMNGRVSVADDEKISLAATFGESSPDDIFAIFAHQLEKITWIPHGMTGSVKGGVKVGGRYTDGLNTLEIDSRLTGKNLSYKGEMIHDLDAHAGVTNGVAFAKEARGMKYDTPVSGWIEYNLKTDEMSYVLNAEKGKLRSLDFLSGSGVPLDGLFSLRSEGRGRWETLESKTTFDVSNAFVRTRPLLPLNMAYETHPAHSDFSVRFGPHALLSGRIAHAAQGESWANFSAKQANLDFLLCMLSRSNCTDPLLGFNASASAKFTWRGGDWRGMGGSGMLEEMLVTKTGYSLRLPSPVAVSAAGGMVESANGQLEGEETRIGFRFKGRVDGEKLDNSLKGNSSLKLLEFIDPLVEEARGRLRLDLHLTGNLQNGLFRGSVSVEEGLLRLSGLDATVDNLEARLKLADSRVSIESFTGQLGGGTVQATGGMDLYLDRAPHFGIDLYLANNRLKFFPVNYAEISDAKLSLTGEFPPYLFAGTARIKKVMMHNNFDLGRQKGLQNARYLPEKVAGVKSFYETRIRAVAESGVFVDNNLLNAEFRGEVTLLNNFEFPQVVGRAELVRGKLLFRNTAFTLDHAFIRLPSPEVFNPQFSVGGVSNVDNYRISIFASGTIDKPKITLSSYPALPQEDIVSLLAFGYRGEDARKINPNDTSALTYSEVGSILMEQLQLSQNLQSKGVRVTVAPALTDSEVSLIRPNNSVSNAAPKVYVQTQVMKNLDAAFGGTVGSPQGQSMDAKLEYRLSGKTSVSAVYEQTPSVDATEETRNSYGADLKFRWGFK